MAVESSPQDVDGTLRVMSFNIRYGTANDGMNRWRQRKQLVAKAIQRFQPDLLGTQETLNFQADYLRAQLSEYTYYGVGREKNDAGEQCGMFFRADRFEVLGKGTFWLSSQPEDPGSKSWDSSLPRIASWLHLRDKQQAGKKLLELVFVNTHFDHRGVKARLEAARLIRRYLENLGREIRVVVTGDFNCDEGSAPYRALIGENPAGEFALYDTFRVAHPERQSGEGTFGGWTGQRSSGRIDWILHNTHFQTRSASIDIWKQDGRYPSDHFPIRAVLVGK